MLMLCMMKIFLHNSISLSLRMIMILRCLIIGGRFYCLFVVFTRRSIQFRPFIHLSPALGPTVRCFHMKSLFSHVDKCRYMSRHNGNYAVWIEAENVCVKRKSIESKESLHWWLNITSQLIFSLNKSMLGWMLFILIVGWRMLAVTAVPLCIKYSRDTGYIYWDWWDESSERANEKKSRRINNDDNYGQRRETTRHCTALELCQTTRRFFFLFFINIISLNDRP